MTIAQLEETIAHSDATEEELADRLYGLVRGAIEAGERRENVLAMLKTMYADLVGETVESPRRAVREVIGCFYGYCAPEAAL